MASAKFELGPISFETRRTWLGFGSRFHGNRWTERNVSVKPPLLFLNGIFIRIAIERAAFFASKTVTVSTRRHCSAYASRGRHVGNDTREAR